jgi:hypothetical protein
VAVLVLEYYLLLRSVLRAKPHLRECLTRCRHCRIFFLTHPRNGGRQDLGCPFGCRQAGRKQQSARRSLDYYRTPNGKTKKADLNNRHRSWVRRASALQAPTAKVVAPTGTPGGWNEPMVEHVRMVSSLIEDRRVSREEILEMLARVLRQRTMPRRSKIDHVVAWLNEHPP